ncbi:MAG: HDIG domain-containing protein [Bacteroidetes bacterium]|nr:HDIG domain-containing protein [Bacteroidota bacterium]
MKKIIDRVRNDHDSFYKALLFIGTIAFIVFLLPREVSFKYEFQKNKAWHYDNLYAPFDVPILRNGEEIKSEKEKVISEKALYFKYNYEKKEEQVKLFDRLLDEELDAKNPAPATAGKQKKHEERIAVLKQYYFTLGEEIISNIYKKGLIELSDELDKLNDTVAFYVIKDNVVASAFYKEDVFTLKSAFEFAEKTLQKNIEEKEVLLPAIEKTLQKDAANIVFDNKKTQLVLANELSKLEVAAVGIISEGQSIIKRGDIVDKQKFDMLSSYKAKYVSQTLEQSKRLLVMLAQVILISVAIGGFFLYLFFFRRQIFNNNKHLVFLLLLVNIFVLATTVILHFDRLNVYLIPFCLIPIVVRSFFDTRTAFFSHIITLMIIGFMVPDSFTFVFSQFIAGIVAIFGFVNYRKRAQLFITSGLIFLTYSLIFFAVSLQQEGDLSHINSRNFTWFAMSAGFTMFAFPMIYAFEKMFGFISDITLLELSDTNNTLLRELSLKAPGTFQHSLQVANLAEAAIFKVGGNALLIRTAALYHDIGKMERPMYFIENQATGVNPHHELSTEESARIIINHVIQGIEIAKKHRVPEQIIDFIRTHHGTTRAEFFYRKALNEFPDEVIDEKLYTYPGPIPFSKESAVLMMADSVEAASRALKEITSEKIEQLVDRVINKQIEEQQFINADITLKEISQIKKMLKKMLMNIYHVRIEYPNA